MNNMLRVKTAAYAGVALALMFLVACGGGMVALSVSEINGPGSLDERQAADYSVDVVNDTNLSYAWTVTPLSAGSLTNASSETATFHANDVTVDTTVQISASITGTKVEPAVVTREVTVIDTNQMPRASAHSDKTKIGHGQSVQFYDDSTDPEGDSDIVKWEWDFSYVEADGFQSESLEREPSHQFNDPGIFNVQLRVIDRSGIADMLTQPIIIEVDENYAPVISAVTHSRTTSQAGDNGEAVQLGVGFADASPVDDTHTFIWTCDYGLFDDAFIKSPIWYPPNQVVDCDISVQITDWFGLSDEASCHQWVTSLATRVNPTALGNVIPSKSLATAFGGPINPATAMFPYSPNDGNVLLMSYWATFSSASTDGIPELQGVYGSYIGSAYVHIMINEGETAKVVSDYVTLNHCEASYWALDADASYFGLTRGWANNSSSLPQTLLFDRDGHCRWAHVSELTYTGDLQSAIEELL